MRICTIKLKNMLRQAKNKQLLEANCDGISPKEISSGNSRLNNGLKQTMNSRIDMAVPSMSGGITQSTGVGMGISCKYQIIPQ